MPIATPEVYAEMLDRAKAGAFAYPAINVSSSQTLQRRAAGLRRGRQRRHRPGLHRRRGVPLRPDGQGHGRPARSRSRRTPPRSPRTTRSTSRCTPTTARRTSSTASSARCSRSRRSGSAAARRRCSSRTCGTARPCRSRRTCRSPRSCSSLRRGARSSSRSRSASSAARRTASSARSTTSSTRRPRTRLATVEALGTGEKGRYLTALTFGNVHGVYKPGNVKLRPEILKDAQEAVVEKLGLDAGAKPFDLVFHGGSGSLLEEIREAVDYGVVKMNVDTDTQYAFTRPVADHMFAQLRRRAQGRRRGRQQEGLRPARLGQGRRGRHGRPRRRGLREPALGRHLPHRLTGRPRANAAATQL